VGTEPREVEPREQTARHAVKRTHSVCKISRESEPYGENHTEQLSDAAKFNSWSRRLDSREQGLGQRLRGQDVFSLSKLHVRGATLPTQPVQVLPNRLSADTKSKESYLPGRAAYTRVPMLRGHFRQHLVKRLTSLSTSRPHRERHGCSEAVRM